jgi:hypothetical protein
LWYFLAIQIEIISVNAEILKKRRTGIYIRFNFLKTSKYTPTNMGKK